MTSSDIRRSPYSREAEQCVLGAMMVKPELIDLLTDEIGEADFYFTENVAVFRAIMALKSEQEQIDCITVAEKLQTIPPHNEPALMYCGQLQKNVPGTSNAIAYARIIRQRSLDRALIQAAAQIHDIAHSDMDAQEKVAASQAEVMSVDATAATAEVVSAADVMRDHINELERRFELDGAMDGLSTGLKDLDASIQGLKPGQLVVVAGRAKMGKTTFAMGIARHNALRAGKSVMVVSLEMSKGQLMDRILSAEGEIPLTMMKNGKAVGDFGAQMNMAASKVINSRLYISDRPSLTISRVRSMARRHKMQHGLDLILIDHIGLLDGEDARASQLQKISEITRQSKILANELGVPVIILCQLNRALEQRPNKRPIPSDLRDSGTIEQDADMVLFVYRDEVYHPDSMDKGIGEIIIGLGRDIETGTIRTAYQGHYNRFVDLAPGYRPPQPAEKPKPSPRGMDL
jgi:replicative DNA helicase